MFKAEHTDPKKIEEKQTELEKHLEVAIRRREKLIREGIEICEKIIDLEKQLDEEEREVIQSAAEEELPNLKKLIQLTRRNSKVASEWKTTLEHSLELLEQAQRAIES